MIHDLHTHSNASDGFLSPPDLLLHAAENGVDVLAITDHDTVAAYDVLQAAIDTGVTLVPGIELSTNWQKRNIHIVGLGIDTSNTVLRDGIVKQQARRLARARGIAKRLTRIGIDDPFDAVAKIAGDASIGRPHFARHLVEIGKVRDVQAAFKKYLGAGKIGDVSQNWPSFAETIQWITAAGGIAVLAHPAKYRFTMTKLRALLDDFVAAGGGGIEVVCGHQEPALTRRLAGLSRDFELLASTGSDFHHPGNKWSRPGGFSQLPDDVRPVWDAW